MELYTIGKHCATCNQLDYLPFLCRTCYSYYCLDHREFAHHVNCSGRENRVVESTTSKPSTTPKRMCAYQDCKATPGKTVAVACRQCGGKNFCLRHRFHDEHAKVGLNARNPGRIAVTAH